MESVKPEKEKKPKKDIVIPPKKPKLSKAERRALQESQRAAKAEVVDGGGAGSKKSLQQQQSPSGSQANEAEKKSGNYENLEGSRDDTLTFFSHLPPYKGENLHCSIHIWYSMCHPCKMQKRVLYI